MGTNASVVATAKPGRKSKAIAVSPALPVPAAPAAPIQTALAVPAKEKSMTEMLHDTADQAKAMFADASSRAQGAMDKSREMMAEATDFSKGNVEAIVESSKIAARAVETMNHDASALIRKAFEDAAAQVRTITAATSPTEMMKLHSDYVRSAFDAMVAETSRGTEALLKLAGEVAQPISNRVALAADKMKVPA